jgi:hypothetical protein
MRELSSWMLKSKKADGEYQVQVLIEDPRTEGIADRKVELVTATEMKEVGMLDSRVLPGEPKKRLLSK